MPEQRQNIEQPGFMIQGTEAFKIAQALYNSVTGKTESLSKRFSENYKIQMNDIFQLHMKIGQMCAQWNVIEKNENITIHHVNDNKETFSSLDRFKVYDQSQTSPIESIVYEFNLLVQLQNTPKPQPYQIIVRLGSKVAIQAKAREELPSAMFFRFFRGGAINVDIQYVDYVVARNMLSTIDSWVSTVESTPKSKFLMFLQGQSHTFVEVCGFLLFMIALIACITSTDILLLPENNDPTLARFLLVSAGIVVFSSFIGRVLGGMVESGIDRFSEISFIKINVGDSRAISIATNNNKKSLAKAVFSLTLLTIHAVGCSYIASVVYESLKAST
jgi:hypothetical protein